MSSHRDDVHLSRWLSAGSNVEFRTQGPFEIGTHLWPPDLDGATPKIEIDPETYNVRADGDLLVCEPADKLPMARQYLLF
jgi:hypothetical protein